MVCLLRGAVILSLRVVGGLALLIEAVLFTILGCVHRGQRK